MNTPKEVKTQRILIGRAFPTIGGVGLAITIAMNFTALLVFKKPAAAFFSHGWWFTWFSSYIVWTSFLIVGLAGVLMRRESHA